MKKRPPAYRALLVIGLGLLPLAFSSNMAFLGMSVVFIIIGAAGIRKEKQAKRIDPPPKEDR